jgi:hypothetical protein
LSAFGIGVSKTELQVCDLLTVPEQRTAPLRRI